MWNFKQKHASVEEEQTSSAVWEIVPDRMRGFSLLGAMGVRNILERSSSGRGSWRNKVLTVDQDILMKIIRMTPLTSPLVDLAWFSSCLFWIHLVFS